MRCACRSATAACRRRPDRARARSARRASSILKSLCAVARRVAQDGARPPPRSCRCVGALPREQRLGVAVAPRLVRHAAQRDARLGDRAAVHLAARPRPRPARRRRTRGRASSGRCSARRSPRRGSSTAVMSSSGSRLVSRCGVSPGRRWNSANGIARSPPGPVDLDDGLERRQRHAHVGRVGGDAVLAGAEDRVDAVDAADAPGSRVPGLALVAGRGGVVEVVAARALQQVAAVGRHVAQLRRGAGQDRPGEQRVALARPARRRRRRCCVTSAPIRRPPSGGLLDRVAAAGG